jgi:glucose-1-phosphate cytidylyltransferase
MSPPEVVILCGGRGTRLQEHSPSIPKALVEVGGEPILWHVIRIFAGQGLCRFKLCTGYKGELIERAVRAQPWPPGVDVRCVDTGIDTPTGGRIARVAALLPRGQTFCVTYGDGLADIDLERLLGFHHGHGRAATMTVVRPELQFGVADVDDDGRVRGFREKPRSEHWINGGFFCLEPAVLDYVGRETVFEQSALDALARAGELRAFRHEGFWDCMDTYKDAVVLNDLWARGDAPWTLRGDQTGT